MNKRKRSPPGGGCVWVLRIVCSPGDPHLKSDFSRVQRERDQVGHAAGCSSRKHLDDSWRRDICVFSTGHVERAGLHEGWSTKTLSPWITKTTKAATRVRKLKYLSITRAFTINQDHVQPQMCLSNPQRVSLFLEVLHPLQKKKKKRVNGRLEFLNNSDSKSEDSRLSSLAH